MDSDKLLLSPWIIRKNEQKSLQCFFGGQEEGREVQGLPEEQEVHLLMEKLQIEDEKTLSIPVSLRVMASHLIPSVPYVKKSQF